jgi:hypothetical protein
MDFIAELIFYEFFWAIGVTVLYALSLGRIVPTKDLVNGSYQRTATGKIVVRPGLVACAGMLAFVVALAVWVSLLH